jgi:hypothetical protein
MANVIMFFGHGSFDPNEAPQKTAVPNGCRFCLYTRHKEEIAGTRMTYLSYAITSASLRALEEEAAGLAGPDFIDEMNANSNLRRIKTAGQRVHNYRLFPPAGLLLDPAVFDQSEAVELVCVTEPEGRTLESLFSEYGNQPGHVLMWVACRAVVGREGTMVDGYDLPLCVTTLSDGAATVYRRPTTNYFKR